ncbi:hypothetical protein EJ08DRAFT_143391 [Tothia fuscella]|uniref:Uncharacterized protein n=1 Tax=Tothia fuscella TaxID=1048955 RepID=A0A9P4P186_9PEZI|nr:hypothetical protein EJ08DRAFT_143391 [Tothia fuscella]
MKKDSSREENRKKRIYTELSIRQPRKLTFILTSSLPTSSPTTVSESSVSISTSSSSIVTVESVSTSISISKPIRLSKIITIHTDRLLDNSACQDDDA